MRISSLRIFCFLVALCLVTLNVVLLVSLHQSLSSMWMDFDLESPTANLPEQIQITLDLASLWFAATQNTTNDQNLTLPRRFLKFDEAAPPALLARSHSLPNAVPLHRVIPIEQAENESYHIARRLNTSSPSILGQRGRKRPFHSDAPNSGRYNWNHDYATDYRTLYLYNPSVLPLDQNDPDALSALDWEALTGNDETVKYLATFRANTGGNCFGADRPQVMKTGEQVSYLAVALMDADLNIITDTLIDLNAGPSLFKYWLQLHEDCKIVLLRGIIYFLCNERLFRVTIRRSTQDKPLAKGMHTASDRKIPYVYPNIYGKGLEITLWNRTKIAGGKNFNIFRVPSSSGSFEHYLQVYPLPHRYHRLKVPAKDDNDPSAMVSTESEQESTAPLPRPSFDGPDTGKLITTCPENEKPNTWITNCTKPTKRPFFGDSDHGTACCVTLTLKNSNEVVLVGISHTKTSGILNPWWLRDIYHTYYGPPPKGQFAIGHKRYLSRFVAYRREPPFDVVARSGWFCLGFSEPNETGGNTLAGRNMEYRLDLFNETYNCPMIHFASGIADMYGDPSKAIISYGVADCYPRMIVVEKDAIAQRLMGA